MKINILMLFLMIILMALIVYFVLKSLRYKNEREKDAVRKSFIAYLMTDSLLISWLVYKKSGNIRN